MAYYLLDYCDNLHKLYQLILRQPYVSKVDVSNHYTIFFLYMMKYYGNRLTDLDSKPGWNGYKILGNS